MFPVHSCHEAYQRDELLGQDDVVNSALSLQHQLTPT